MSIEITAYTAGRRINMLVNKPPMGWNSWNTFGGGIDEKLIIETADAMIEQGYADLGYEYVIIDDCWALKERDKNGKLVPDPKKFPHGMKYVSDYVHSKGLKFGMYSCAGVMTCGGYPSSFGHEYEDAKQFAEWGVDYLKYDFCYFPKTADCKNAYLTMSMALRTCGRDILFAACNWGVEEPWKWMRSIGVHTYRSTGDIFDKYVSMRDIVQSQENNFSMSAPQCFNDIDMLTVGMYGNGLVGIENGCTDEEYTMEFALWCIYGAPLIIGGDIRSMSENAKKLLQNKELIAINQDAECREPYKLDALSHEKDRIVLFKIMDNKEYAIMLVNYSDSKIKMAVSLKDLGMPYECGTGLELHDVITGEEKGVVRDYYAEDVEGHSCVVLKGKAVNV